MDCVLATSSKVLMAGIRVRMTSLCIRIKFSSSFLNSLKNIEGLGGCIGHCFFIKHGCRYRNLNAIYYWTALQQLFFRPN
jgi:hypothetical protein